MAHLGTFKVNTGKEFVDFETLPNVSITFEEGKTYIGQVQGGNVIATSSIDIPDGGFLVERDEGFAFTPKNGTKLWVKNVASTDVHITISD